MEENRKALLAECKVEWTGSSGPGGQNVNRNRKNVRLTHLETGLQVVSRGRSAHSNLQRALKELERRLEERNRVMPERVATKKTRRTKAKERDANKAHSRKKADRKRVRMDD